MKVIFCDLCENLIKSTDKRYYIAIIKADEKEKGNRNLIMKDEKELLLLIQNKQEEMAKEYDTIKIYEICDKCKKVYDYIFGLRKNKVKALKKEANKILKNNGDKKNEK